MKKKKNKIAKPKQIDVNQLRNNAVAIHQQNKLIEAERLYKQLLTILPNDTTCWTNLGTLEYQRGNFKDAIQFIDKSLKLDPNQPYAYNNRGNILKDLNLVNEALESYSNGIAIDDKLPELLYNRAITLHELGRVEEALESYTKTIEVDKHNIKAYINLGNILHELNRSTEAIENYNKVKEIQPNFALAYVNCGIVYQHINDIEKALENYEQSLAIEPIASVYSNRGNIYQNQHKLLEAIDEYDKAIKIDPTFQSAHGNKANALLTIRRLEEAEKSYSTALTIDPDFADALWNKSILLLLYGKYEEGFKLFENRWRSALKNYYRKYDKPLWNGQSLDNKTIFIYPEQGLGDFIQFCRYLPMFNDMNCNVIVEVPILLRDLVKTIKCNATFLDSETMDRNIEYDYHCPIMSLPGGFKTTLETIPANIPYLQPIESKQQYWADKLGTKTKPRIGLVWSGGFRPDQPETWAANSRRNIKLANLECFKDIDAEFYSIQKGAPEKELTDLVEQNWNGPTIISYTNELVDFADTAAFISQLDLVISVDTSTAHVAAAIGKPVWIFNRFDSCWRWLLNRTDSPWYPTVTLFNQKVTNEWEEVIQQIHEKLKTL